MRKCVMAGLFLCASLSMYAQPPVSKKDTIDKFHSYLPEITVVGRNSNSDIQQLPEIVGTSIYAGKKNALIVVDNVKGNVVTNTMRQVMAKVPGIHVWESDGSGIQIGISARGLSANRSWEFNVRQNGYDIAADPFGYPEAYYNPQLQAVQRIEVVRGQGSLQYGPQFGGMVNYILRNGSEINKPFEAETQQTVGSNGLFNSYIGVGGETKRSHYYGFFDHRNANGWRQNSQYFTNAGFGTYTYRITDKFSLTAEWMHSHIRSQQPGGITDAQLETDARWSDRPRNWMDIKWTTAALIANYQINEQSKLNIKLFGVMGDRNSVGLLKAINVRDTIAAGTLAYANRTVDIDNYRNAGLETRYLSSFKWAGRKHHFSGGLRLYQGTTHRYRDGKGTTGSNYTIERVDGGWPRDIQFRSYNAAVFTETIFRLNEKWLIIPGIRYEYLTAEASGRNGFAANGDPVLLQEQRKGRGFLLGGIGIEYHNTSFTELYGNITQAYRPIQFADLTAPPGTDVIDPEMRDAKGYNIDWGYRGRVNDVLHFDVSVFYLRYSNRIGVLTQQRADGSFYNYRTNVGNSTSKGVEAMAECNILKGFGVRSSWQWSVFASYGYTDARYGNLRVITKSASNDLVETNLKNKKVENAPEHILRSGMTLGYKKWSLTGQWSYTASAFADANNTEAPTANGQNGLIPSYQITDLTIGFVWSKQLQLRAGMNNVFDARYFTRRAGGYPGPGLLPADGRNVFLTLLLKH